MSRTEPDLPSIHTPLSHDAAVATLATIETTLPSETHSHAHELQLDIHRDGEQPQIYRPPTTRKPIRGRRPATAATTTQPTLIAHKRSTATPSANRIRSPQVHRRSRSVLLADGRVRNVTLTYEEGHDPDRSISPDP